ncbi:MAG TPA: translocation/assembly module TamB domain-containing protein, partial [Draconibacterium sp.]|nr:translocation/assembly module TamB domain-containing protein [Draconibacterium sp.]
QLIYNSQIGDVIRAQGEGILLFEMDDEGNMSLSGNYNPTRGDYLFTLQSLMNKRFSIEPGGSIIWSGDPYNAVVDLQATYRLRASLYDLIVDNSLELSQTNRVQVECVINLQDELINPTIGFEVNFPNVEERVRDELSQFFNTDEEINKQIVFLIGLGKFYTPDYLRGTYQAQNTNMLGTTASEVFSNQLSNWLSQINDDWDVGINYRPGNQVTQDEIELALSTQIFNDRITLNGNIGNNTNQYGINNNSSQIVGDFEMNVKLVRSGKILFKAYNRSNNNLIYETAPYTQGIGLSFKEEFNSIDELVKKFSSIFSKKDR